MRVIQAISTRLRVTDPGRKARWSSRSSSAGSRALSLNLLGGGFEEFDHLRADLGVGHRQTGRIEIAADLAEHVLVPGFLEFGFDDLARIGIDIWFAQLRGCPLAKKLVTARQDLELGLLVMGELVL